MPPNPRSPRAGFATSGRRPSRLRHAAALAASVPMATVASAAPSAFTVSLGADGRAERAQTMRGFGTAAAVFMDNLDGTDWYDYGRFADVLVNDFNADFLRVELSHQAFATLKADATTRADLDYSRRTLAVGTAGAADLGSVLDANAAMFDFEAFRARVSGRAAEAVTAAGVARGRGVNVIASLWTPPPYYKGEGVFYDGRPAAGPTNGPFGPQDSVGGTVEDNAATYLQYGEYVAAYVHGFERHWGVELEAVSIQNEPDQGLLFNSQLLENPERYGKVLVAVNDAFDKYGIDTKIIGPEFLGIGSQIGTPFQDRDDPTSYTVDVDDRTMVVQAELWETLQADPATRDLIDVYAVHGSDGRGRLEGPRTDREIQIARRWEHLRDGFDYRYGDELGEFEGIGRDRELWMTETSGDLHVWVPTAADIREDRERVGQPSPEAYQNNAGALGQAVSMHHALASGDVSSYLFWQLTYDTAQELDQPSRFDENFVLLKVGDDQVYDLKQKKYAVAKHYSRFARAGMTRIELDLASAVERDVFQPFTGELLGSLFVDEATGEFSLVFVNELEGEQEVTVNLSALGALLTDVETLAGVVTDADRTFASMQPVVLTATGDLLLALGGQSVVSLSSNPAFVPEPGAALLLAGVGGLLLRRRRAAG